MGQRSGTELASGKFTFENTCNYLVKLCFVLFELPCYPQFELEIHIVEVSYFINILIK